MKKISFIIIIFMTLSAFAPATFVKEHTNFFQLIKEAKIAAVAPASGLDIKIINNLKNAFTLTGLNIKFPLSCFDDAKQPFHSHNDEMRFKCLKDALYDDSIDVIWSLRGGYGSAKLISKLEKLEKPFKEKKFIGYSDITALHLFFAQKWGWKTIHGAGLAELLDSKKERSNFIELGQIIKQKEASLIMSGLRPLNKLAHQVQNIEGLLTGGNLTIVQTSIGTSWQIQTENKIIFLEDRGVAPYQVDRALHHMKQAGLFEKAVAIILGDYGNDKTMEKTLENIATIISIPVYKTDKFGHEKINEPLIYNAESNIILSNNKTYDLIMKVK